MKELNVKTISYARTLNRQNYENSRLEIEVECDGRDPEEVLQRLKKYVIKNLEEELTPRTNSRQ